jgi:hypothetical protein
MLRISSLLLFIIVTSLSAQAKIWRVNNNSGVTADFTDLPAAISSASVLSNDTIHVEASSANYNFITLNKNLVFIGVGYFLNPADPSVPGNAGLQVATTGSRVGGVSFTSGSQGSRFIGITFTGSVGFSGALSGAVNMSFEKCLFASGSSLQPGSGNYSGLTVRKCFFDGIVISQTSGSLSGFICENSIFRGNSINVPAVTGSNNIIRNNSFFNSGGTMAFSNCYVANNIFGYFGTVSFINCTVKNNLFQQTSATQTVPGTATGNVFNVNMATVYVGTGSYDDRYQIQNGSLADNTGVTVGSVVNPDCGAYGGTDPYKLSGIPNVPSIYGLTAPNSIPAGTNSMSVTISTRNNN